MKPFGYILKSRTPGSKYPWMNSRWSDAPGCCGNFRANIGDATVYKRLGYAKRFIMNQSIVKVWSDPAKTGDLALHRLQVTEVDGKYVVTDTETEIGASFVHSLIPVPQPFYHRQSLQIALNH